MSLGFKGESEAEGVNWGAVSVRVLRSRMRALAGHVWDSGEEKELESEHCVGVGQIISTPSGLAKRTMITQRGVHGGMAYSPAGG